MLPPCCASEGAGFAGAMGRAMRAKTNATCRTGRLFSCALLAPSAHMVRGLSRWKPIAKRVPPFVLRFSVAPCETVSP